MRKIKTKTTGKIYLQVGLDMKRSESIECWGGWDMLLYKSEIIYMQIKFYSAFGIKEKLKIQGTKSILLDF